MQLPLCSSELVCKILERDGFEFAQQSGRKKNGSSHRTYKKRVGDRTRVTPVVLDKKQIPRGTLRSILNLAGMSDQRFLDLYDESK